MAISLLSLDLVAWDETRRDVLVVTSFLDERPLRGAAGLVDWRLHGGLSKLLAAQKLSGAHGERLLLPPGKRLPLNKVLWMGLGATGQFNMSTFVAALGAVKATLDGMGATQFAWQLPGRALDKVAPREAFDAMLVAFNNADSYDITLIEDAAGRRAIGEFARQFAASPLSLGQAGAPA